jgi:WD40 repeat protein
MQAAVAFSPDGRTLAVEGLGGDTALWEVTTGHLIADLGNPSASARMSLDFAPFGIMILNFAAGQRSSSLAMTSCWIWLVPS